MILTIMERIVSTNLIPPVGDMLYLRMRHDLIDKLGLSGEEIEKYSLVEDKITGTATWNPDIPQETEVELTDAEVRVITENLQ